MSERSASRVLGTISAVAAAFIFLGADAQASDGSGKGPLQRTVDDAIRPVMQGHRVPGMVVALTVPGQHHFFSDCVAAKSGGQKLSERIAIDRGGFPGSWPTQPRLKRVPP